MHPFSPASAKTSWRASSPHALFASSITPRPATPSRRFCKQPYSCDWRQQLSGDGPLEPESATPVMAVSAGGRVFKLKVLPGPQGKAIFKQQVRNGCRGGADAEARACPDALQAL